MRMRGWAVMQPDFPKPVCRIGGQGGGCHVVWVSEACLLYWGVK